MDLGIATLIWPLSLVLPLEQAQAIGIVLWPAILFVLLVVFTGFSARKMFGPLVGAMAIIAVMLWPVTGQTYFTGVRLDHHNVQILLMTVMTFAGILPGSAVKRGVISGLSAALSLAVGLEALLVIALFGVILVVRALLLRRQALPQLVAFSVAVAIGSVALFIGQTPVSEWALRHCDELSVPYLSIAVTGAVICVFYALLATKLSHLIVRATVFLGLCALGVVLLYSIIQPCFAGPYGSLPQDVADIIRYRVSEARPALQTLLEGKPSAYAIAIPTMVATILATGIWMHRLIFRQEDKATTACLGYLLIFAWLGVIASLSQIRLTLLAASVIPILIGFALAEFLSARRERQTRGAMILGLPILIIVMAPYAAGVKLPQIGVQEEVESAATSDQPVAVESCRQPDLLRELADLPAGVVLTGTNFSAPILLLTPHSVVTGPYHRSPAAFRDGSLPFEQDEAALHAAARRTDADYLLLCRNGIYGHDASFGTQLSKGGKAEWLSQIDGINPKLLMFRVLKD